MLLKYSCSQYSREEDTAVQQEIHKLLTASSGFTLLEGPWASYLYLLNLLPNL